MIRVHSVQVVDETHLMIDFDNGEKKLFDVSPCMEKGIFKEFKDYGYFKQVRVSSGTIVWPNEQDFCPDTLYLKGCPYENKEFEEKNDKNKYN